MTIAELTEDDLLPDPIALVQRWFADAQAAGIEQVDAMTLATATPDGRPSARVVLLKGIDARGFAFFTNYESRKGGELDANPHAALVLLWVPLQRQVRVDGPRRAAERRGVRRLLRIAAARQPARRLGVPAEPAAGATRGARRALGRARRALRRRVDAAPAALGRLPRRAGRDRGVAGRANRLTTASPIRVRPRRLDACGSSLSDSPVGPQESVRERRWPVR